VTVKRRLALLGSISLMVLGLAWFCPIGHPRPFQRAALEQVVTQIEQGTFRPDGQGVVALPPQLASLSATGKAYVRRDTSGGMTVFFPAWVGRNTLLISPLDVSGDNWLEGYLYDSHPAGREPTDPQGGEGAWGEALGPPPAPPWEAAHQNGAMPRNLCMRSPLGGRWYYTDIFS
jgi:hypothetical protein